MRDNYSNTIKGAGALQEALDLIGDTDPDGDKRLSKIIVDNELALRDLIRFALNSISNDI